MAEIDTSSYPKPGNSPGALDIAKNYGAVQQQALGIEKQKLELVNARFGEMAKGFTNLIAKPDLNLDDVRKYVENQVKLGYVPAEMAATTLSTLPPTQGMPADQASNTLRGALKQHLQHAETMVETMNRQFGTNVDIQDNRNIYSGVRASPMEGSVVTPKTITPIQLSPTQPIKMPGSNEPGIAGPSGPPGPRPFASPSVNAQPPAAISQRRGNLARAVEQPAPVAAPAITGPTGPTVSRGTEFNDRFSAAFPNAVATGPAPGVVEAQTAVGGQSGKDYATDLNRTKSLQADLQPDLAVLNIVKDKKPTDFGPGTDLLNQIKKTAATWLPGVDPKVLNDATDYDTVKKYLVQGARSAGNTGTNDQLAAAFEANPNTTMSTATIENIVKSRVALRKMQAAQTLLFTQQGLPENEYSKWIAKYQNVLDPRAFGFDMMTPEARDKLISGMADRDRNGNWIAKKGKEKEFQRFETSLQFANDANLIEPPGRQ